AGLKANDAEGGEAVGDQRYVAARAGSRLFLSQAQSGQAAATRLVPAATRSILNVRRKLRYGDFVWTRTKLGTGPLLVRINLDQQLLSVFRGGHEIGTAVILYGVEGHDTPTGRFPVIAKIEDHHSAT